MDSYADLQPVSDHHDANPPPPPHYPPYSEMIIAAICALKDKDGSSRQAIAKYIEKEYTDLPPAHPTLLTNHLKRMKNVGELVMVKHSYMVPPPYSTDDTNFFAYANANLNANADVNADVNVDVGGENSVSLTPRRKPGRPPKPRQDFGFQPNSGGVQDFQPQMQSDDGAEPVFADDGVAPIPPPENENVAVVSAKRGRGRPPKSVASGSAAGSGDVGDSDEVVEQEKRKPGRPKSMSVGGSGEVVEQEKRKPGRPKSMSAGGGRRGRPKRIGGSGPVDVSLTGDAARPSGRPKRSVTKPQTMYDVNGGGVETGSVSRGRGRPPKSKFRKLSSQSFDRPIKAGPGTAIIVKDPHQLLAYQELKSKYEHLQAKAKEVMGVVRPYVNPEYEAFGALQELESLVF